MLVVACPVRLILATPAAVIAALGRLAGTGVLIKGGSALERLAGVNAFAFDKTGTLTEGRLELGEVVAAGGVAAEERAAHRGGGRAAQRTSAGPADRRTRRPHAATEPSSRSRSSRPTPAPASRAHTASRDAMLVGTGGCWKSRASPLPPEARRALERLDAAGQTVLLVARDGVVLGGVGARDRLRPEAAGVLAELRAAGHHATSPC